MSTIPSPPASSHASFTEGDLHGVPGAPLSPIIGRDRQIGEVVALLDRGDARVVTLLGPGGVGKTRLAHAVIEAIAPTFAHAARFVPLDAIRNAALVPGAVALALGLVETAERAAPALIAEHLADRHLLLVLDNMEHVIGAASPWLSDLLRQARRLTVLVTSRTPLNIDGEHQYIVPTLETVDVSPDGSAAVHLFAARARAVRHDFVVDERNIAVVAEICRKLDGLPLAIELAAARMKMLPPETLLSRLTDRLNVLTDGHRDAPPRLRSMRDAIGWSYERLSSEERELFRRLSVFLGGFSLDAVELVATWPQPPEANGPALGTLQALVDHSLVQVVPGTATPRYRMLETIREYGAERVQNDKDAAPQAAHADYVRELTRRAAPELFGANQGFWLDRLVEDFANIRAAVDWLEQHDRLDHAMEIVTRISPFGEMRDRAVDLLRWLERWLESPATRQDTRTRAVLLQATGTLLFASGNFHRAVELLRESVALFETVDDRSQAALGMAQLGGLMGFSGHADAVSVLEKGLQLARDTGHQRALSMALSNLAQSLWAQEESDRFRTYASEAYENARRHGDQWMMAHALLVPMMDALHQGRLDEGERLLREMMRLREGFGVTSSLAGDSAVLAWIARRQGDDARAESHLATALRVVEDTGHGWYRSLLSVPAAVLAAELGNRERARALLATSLRGFATHHRRDQLARTLAGYAVLAQLSGDTVTAAQFLGASDTFGEEIHDVREEPGVGVDTAPYRARIRAELDDAAFQTAHDTGAGWSVTEALAAGLAYQPPVSRSSSQEDDAPDHGPVLSPREREVLAHMANGLSNQQIADTLFVSYRTVTTHVTNIMTKLDVSSRTAAVAWAIRSGMA